MTKQELHELWEDLSFQNPDIPPFEAFLKAKQEERLTTLSKLTYGKATIVGENAGTWEWEMK